MRPGVAGFLAGSLGLVVVWAVLRPDVPKAVTAGGKWGLQSLARLLSADVAGVPVRGVVTGAIGGLLPPQGGH